MEDVLVTSVVIKSNVTLVDITSTRMMGQYGFLAKVGRQAVWVEGQGREGVHELVHRTGTDQLAVSPILHVSNQPAVPPSCPPHRQVFDVFARNKISVDVVATSEVSVSLTLDPAK